MRFGGIVLAALLALAGCSSDPEPKEPRASATPTPTATVPTMPAQARQDSPEGAAAFVKHYVDVFNYAAATGDVRELSKLSSPTCSGCQSYIKLYKDTYAAGGYFKGGEWKIGRVEVETSNRDSRVFAHLESERGMQAESSSAKAGPTSPEDSELIFRVAMNNGSHQLLQLSRSAS